MDFVALPFVLVGFMEVGRVVVGSDEGETIISDIFYKLFGYIWRTGADI